MSAAVGAALRHAFCWYGDEPDLVESLAAAALDGLAAGGTVATGLRPATEAALRARIAGARGDDALAGLVRLERVAGPDGPSGQTDAVTAARELRAWHRSTGAPLTVVAEHAEGFDDTYWCEAEAAAQVALADLPLLLVCFFPRGVAPAVASVAREAHPLELAGGRLRPCPDHVDPRRMLAGYRAAVPAALGPPDRDLAFDAARLRDVRDAVSGALRAQGFGRRRAEDVTVAVNEVATNAVHHGGGAARLLLWTPGDDLVCEVHDRGRLADPLPGVAPPDPASAHGRGLWIARQLCDLLHVWADDEGTHVRIRAGA